MNKIVLRTGLGAAAIALCAAGLYGETIVHSAATPGCADGACVPRRLTNGYYPTIWRRWPVEPPAPEKPGVREGIPAPGVEMPPPQSETALPRGVLIEPPPLEDGGGGQDFDSPLPERPTVPSGPATPRREPPEGLPLDLRGGRSRIPTNRQMPGSPRAIAGRAINRPAAVIEALRNEAASHPADAHTPRSISRIPAALPQGDGMAQPMPPNPAKQTPLTRPAETPSLLPRAVSVPTSQALHFDDEPMLPANHAGNRQGRTNWGPTRTMRADTAQPESPIIQPDDGGWNASPEQAAPRQASSGLNAPAAIYARTLAGEVRRPATRADFSISAPASPAVLAVRTVSDEGWSVNSQFRNPLRGASAVTKVAFETSDASIDDRPVNPVNDAARSLESEGIEVPNNPLRKSVGTR